MNTLENFMFAFEKLVKLMNVEEIWNIMKSYDPEGWNEFGKKESKSTVIDLEFQKEEGKAKWKWLPVGIQL